MTGYRSWSAAAVVLTLAVAVGACERAEILEPSASASLQGSVSGCEPTGTGLTAKVVNRDVVGDTVDVGSCDVGAFFSESGRVRGAAFVQPDTDANSGNGVQYAVLAVDGARVDVRGSSVAVTDDYARQFIGIGLRDGARGTIADNTVTGFHRVGILLEGAGTAATVRRNVVTGIGEKTSGWAENGIQVSGGARGTLVDNEVADHWWDENDFLSAGVIVIQADGVTLRGNRLAGNDAGMVLFGDRHKAVRNRLRATAPDGQREGTLHYGALVSGRNNALVHNDFRTGTAADVGIYVFAGSRNTKLIGNAFSGGFATPTFDGGDDTKLPSPFVP